ncbi:MAG: hypothetical protein H7839_19880 [Magnetococcus sp. YQC-5]
MANIFYVSSFGGSGTLWLARALDLHEKIICFHGSRRVPQLSARHFPDIDVAGSVEYSADEFAQHLSAITTQNAEAFGDQEMFAGAVHGFHGLQMEKPMSDRDGGFAISIRHPILRIASLFQHQYQEMKINDKINQQKCQWLIDGFVAKYEYLVKLFCCVMEPEPDDILFMWLASVTLGYDWITSNVPEVPVFRMEDYTSNQDTFASMFQILTKNKLECSADYLERVFMQGKINTHRKSTHIRTGQEEYDNWPDRFKMIIGGLLHSMPDLIEMYDKLGYSMDYAFACDPFKSIRSQTNVTNTIRFASNLSFTR